MRSQREIDELFSKILIKLSIEPGTANTVSQLRSSTSPAEIRHRTALRNFAAAITAVNAEGAELPAPDEPLIARLNMLSLKSELTTGMAYNTLWEAMLNLLVMKDSGVPPAPVVAEIVATPPPAVDSPPAAEQTASAVPIDAQPPTEPPPPPPNATDEKTIISRVFQNMGLDEHLADNEETTVDMQGRNAARTAIITKLQPAIAAAHQAGYAISEPISSVLTAARDFCRSTRTLDELFDFINAAIEAHLTEVAVADPSSLWAQNALATMPAELKGSEIEQALQGILSQNPAPDPQERLNTFKKLYPQGPRR